MPLIALPLALTSHFVLDYFPHFGLDTHTDKKFKIILALDTLVASLILLFILITQPQHWPLLMACAILAASPDLMWLPRWLNELKGKRNRPMNRIELFHSRIQHEYPWGIFVETVWFVSMAAGLLRLVTKS